MTISTLPTSVLASAYPTQSPSSVSVAKTTNSSLVAKASSISEDSALFATMGADTSSLPQASDANSLLSWFVSPFGSSTISAPASGDTTAASTEQSNVNSAIDSSISGGSGTYSSTGALQSLGTAAASGSSSMLKNNPALAGMLSSATVNNAILSGISTYA